MTGVVCRASFMTGCHARSTAVLPWRSLHNTHDLHYYCCYGSQNLVSGRFREKISGFVFGFCPWWRHYKLMYTPAIEHFSPVQTKRNYRPTCHAFYNNAEAIIISDGHLKGLDISASRQRQDAVAPFNTALFDLHLDHSTITSSLRWHPALSAVASLMHATQQI